MSSELPFELLADGWEITTLGEICQRGGGEVQTGPFGSQLHAEDYVDDRDGIPSIMPQDLIAGRVDTSNIARISEADAQRLARHRVQEGDIVYSRRGDIRRRALIRGEQEGWLCGTGCLRVRTGEGAHPPYIAAYLGHPAVQDWIERHAVGATMLNLNTGILAAVPVALPPHETQQHIAAVLGVLDAKIDSNGRVVERLLDTARGLFDAALATRAVETAVGEQGEFHNRRRRPLSAAQRREMPGEIPYYGATGVFDFVAEGLFDEVLLLVGEDGSVIRPDGTPVTQYVWGRAWVNNHAHVLTGRAVSTELLMLAVERAQVGSWVTGAVQPKLSMTNLRQVPIHIPAEAELQQLEPAIAALFALLRGMTEEGITLTKLRDALLPKLVSGAVQTRAGADQVEELAA